MELKRGTLNLNWIGTSDDRHRMVNLGNIISIERGDSHPEIIFVNSTDDVSWNFESFGERDSILLQLRVALVN